MPQSITSLIPYPPPPLTRPVVDQSPAGVVFLPHLSRIPACAACLLRVHLQRVQVDLSAVVVRGRPAEPGTGSWRAAGPPGVLDGPDDQLQEQTDIQYGQGEGDAWDVTGSNHSYNTGMVIIRQAVRTVMMSCPRHMSTIDKNTSRD